MTAIQAIILAIVEGLTEFLPVSSTAHMKFTNPIIGVESTPFSDMMEIVIQLAAILAVVVVYYKKFFDFTRVKFYIKLVIAVIPALVFGALLKKHIDNMLGNLYIIAGVMIAGGIVFLFVDKWFTTPTIDHENQVGNGTAFRIGCWQVLSILFPGLSRSASTIIGGMQQGLSRRAAAEFSFFLAVPTMFAATAHSLFLKHWTGSGTEKKGYEILMESSANIQAFIIGNIVAFVVALVAIKFFIGYLQKHGFKWFGWYRVIGGAVLLALVLSGYFES